MDPEAMLESLLNQYTEEQRQEFERVFKRAYEELSDMNADKAMIVSLALAATCAVTVGCGEDDFGHLALGAFRKATEHRGLAAGGCWTSGGDA